MGTVRIKFLQVSFQSTPPARGATPEVKTDA